MLKSTLASQYGGSVSTQYWGVQCGEHLGCAELAHAVQCLSCECEDLSSNLQHRQTKLSIQPCIHNPRLGHQGFWAHSSSRQIGELWIR